MFATPKPAWLIPALTIIIGLLMGIASIMGAFGANFYVRDAAMIAAGTSGQDLFNLVILLPIFVISSILTLRGFVWALPVWLACVAYVLYSYLVLAFGIYFNRLFLVYVALVAFALYGLIGVIPFIRADAFMNQAKGSRATLFLQGLLLLIALLFTVLWLAMIVPSIQADTIPEELVTNRLLTQPVHVVDLAWIMPGMVLTVIAMFRQWSPAYVLAPAFALLTVFMAGALGAMTLNTIRLGVATDYTLVAIFAVLMLLCSIAVVWYLRQLMPIRSLHN